MKKGNTKIEIQNTLYIDIFAVTTEILLISRPMKIKNKISQKIFII